MDGLRKFFYRLLLLLFYLLLLIFYWFKFNSFNSIRRLFLDFFEYGRFIDIKIGRDSVWSIKWSRGDKFTIFMWFFINSSIQRQEILITISITLVFLAIKLEISKLVETMNLFILFVHYRFWFWKRMCMMTCKIIKIKFWIFIILIFIIVLWVSFLWLTIFMWFFVRWFTIFLKIEFKRIEMLLIRNRFCLFCLISCVGKYLRLLSNGKRVL